ncbi:MAG: hypothetical protein ACN2B6_06660 [Rickettsiales bacterium]
MRSWITSENFGQEVIAETTVDGRPVLITHGDKTQQQVMGLLKENGNKFGIEKKAVGFKDIAWPTRSILGFSGQGLQFIASIVGNKVNSGLLLFSLSNITANTMGLVFGAQRTEDKNRLRFLKEQFNDSLGPHVAPGETLPDVTSKRSALHEEKEQLGPRQQFGAFLRRNSVTIGEIGLRYIGAFGLIFPFTQWKTAGKYVAQGAFKEAYLEGRNTLPWVRRAGITSMIGKTVALTSKAEDPYDPKPKGAIEQFREKVAFKLGGNIEAAAFGVFTVDAFKRGTETHHPAQFLSGSGGAMFTTAYLIRNWAKFGVKETNMEELYAHVTDSLAKVTPEELPQLMADTAASMKEHFKDKPMDFGKVFTQLMSDMYRYHHIALDNLGTEPEERAIKTARNKTSHVSAKHTLRTAKTAHSDAPPALHVDKLAAQSDKTEPHTLSI